MDGTQRTVADLSYLLSHAARVLETRMTAAFAEVGASPREFCVLYHALQEERTQIQLAAVVDLDKTTMVTTLDELERAGLARRRPSATDRRARIVAVTEAGERAVEDGIGVADRVHGEVLAALPPDARTAFVDALSLLVHGPLAEPVACDRPVRRRRADAG